MDLDKALEALKAASGIEQSFSIGSTKFYAHDPTDEQRKAYDDARRPIDAIATDVVHGLVGASKGKNNLNGDATRQYIDAQAKNNEAMIPINLIWVMVCLDKVEVTKTVPGENGADPVDHVTTYNRGDDLKALITGMWPHVGWRSTVMNRLEARGLVGGPLVSGSQVAQSLRLLGSL